MPTARAGLAEPLDPVGIESEGDGWKARGKWDWLGIDARRDGAGGQNRTAYAGLFRAALYR